MRQPRYKLTRATVTNASVRAKEHEKYILEQARKLTEDPEKKARLEACKCKVCFYTSRIGGAAMTSKECDGCGHDEMYGSTATDRLCLGCATHYDLCKQCGGDLHMRVNRRNWPDLTERDNSEGETH